MGKRKRIMQMLLYPGVQLLVSMQRSKILINLVKLYLYHSLPYFSQLCGQLPSSSWTKLAGHAGFKRQVIGFSKGIIDIDEHPLFYHFQFHKLHIFYIISNHTLLLVTVKSGLIDLKNVKPSIDFIKCLWNCIIEWIDI